MYNITTTLNLYSTIIDLISLFFFFQCYGDHQDLHSFPTRRSSDLASYREIIKLGYEENAPLAAKADGRQAKRRSEEHTSELQSRGHLVCRLLLEKKKKKQTINIKVNEITN